MKVFISADIEGIATTCKWSETSSANKEYDFHANEMTKEVVAACRGAIEAGATEILIKDAHGSGTNLDLSMMPEEARVIRGWSGHPYEMVQGIDSTFDAAMYVGYHSEAGSGGNPMSHTMTLAPQHVYINGRPASEFMIYSYCAALEGVPSVFLSGDLHLCEVSKELYPWLVTVPVKEGDGLSVTCLSSVKACKLIQEKVKEALSQDLSSIKLELPSHFDVKVVYKDHNTAASNRYFPGVTMVDEHTLGFEDDDYFEVARKLKYLL